MSEVNKIQSTGCCRTLYIGTLTVEVLVVVLLCPELAPVDERVGRGEIGHRARVQFAACNGRGRERILMEMSAFDLNSNLRLQLAITPGKDKAQTMNEFSSSTRQ